jgi:hypothetical protein
MFDVMQWNIEHGIGGHENGQISPFLRPPDITLTSTTPDWSSINSSFTKDENPRKCPGAFGSAALH